ncbi:MAG: flotillin family protein [Acidimicrobiia bacterium]|nr:flotillin family protein [Acidimicrobiia bacterium]
MGVVVVVAVLLVAVIATVLIAVKSLIVICPPNRVAVISGRQRPVSGGGQVGYRVLRGGRTLRIPLIEKVDWMELNTITIDVGVGQAYSKGAIPLDVEGVANVKVSSQPGLLENSVERFLGRDTEFIHDIAKETLEANLRGVLATLTPEEVNEDRLKFAQTLIEEADDDMKTLGLSLDVLKIQNVTDQVGYLEAVGRRKTAQVLKEARVAEALRTTEAEEEEADARRRAETARVEADLVIVEKENGLRVRNAELEKIAIEKEREAAVAGDRAQAIAEQSLEDERIKLQQRRLEADVITPARAKKEAMELEAKGAAARIIEDGNAQVHVLQRLTDQYQAAGTDAQNIFVLNMLPELVGEIVSTVKGVSIDKVSVIDSGGNGSQGVSNVVGQLPAAVITITEQIENATGVNILKALQKQEPVRVAAEETTPE